MPATCGAVVRWLAGSCPECFRELVDLFGGERAGTLGELCDVGGVVDGDQSVARTAEVQPLAPHEREAERAEHGDIAGVVAIQDVGDAGDLPLERVELARTITTVDDEQQFPTVDDPDGR